MDDYGNGIPAREEGGEEEKKETARGGILTYLPSCAFAVFSVLLFLLFLAPVVSYSGLGGFSVNVYQAELGICTALIVFTALALAASLFGLLLLPLPFLDLGKKSPLFLMLRKVWCVLPLFFYFLIYSFACSLTGLSSALSVQAAGGAAPALVLSFTIVFALLHIVCLLLPKFKK